MPKGKRGPIPEMAVTKETDVEIIEESFLPEDPTAEEIVGEENIVDVGSVEEFEQPVAPQGYKCADCAFTSGLLSEMEEHVNGTGHGKFDTQPIQPELFSTPGTINREIKIPLDETILNEKKTRLALLYQSALDVKEEKKDADSEFNSRLKNIDEQMQEIARVLKKPFTYEMARCEWRIIEEEHARGLYRLDTGELIEKQALSMEDRVKEAEKAEAENAEQEATV